VCTPDTTSDQQDARGHHIGIGMAALRHRPILSLNSSIVPQSLSLFLPLPEQCSNGHWGQILEDIRLSRQPAFAVTTLLQVTSARGRNTRSPVGEKACGSPCHGTTDRTWVCWQATSLMRKTRKQVPASNPAVPKLTPLFGQHPAMSVSAYYDISALAI
jgi:hypothetical protein